MIHVSFTDLRKRLAHFMDRAVDGRAPVLVTRQGHEPVVLIAQSDYATLTELLQKPSGSPESAEAFLRRMRTIGPTDDEALLEVEAAVDRHRTPYQGPAF